MDFLDYLKSLVSGGDDGSQENELPFDPFDLDPGYYSNIPGNQVGFDDPVFNGRIYIGDESDPYGGYDLSALPSADYSNEGRNYPTPESTQGSGGSPVNATTTPDFLSTISKYGKDVVKFFQDNPWAGKLLAGGTGAVLGALDKRPPSGGGVAKAYVGPQKQLTRTIEQGKYGPIARFAAQGGIMHAYRNGGQVRPFPMQDGGFVMTKKAVDGAGGPQGLASLVPGARMIRGPGHGTSDSIPAYIQGPSGRTPARVSNGEAYVPPGRDPRQLQAMMKQLERKA